MPSTIRAFSGRVLASAAVVCAALVVQGCSAFPPAPTRATSFPPQANMEPSVVTIPIDVRIRNFARALNRPGSSEVLRSGWRSVQASSSDGYADVRTLIAQYLNAKVVGSRFVPTEFRLTARRGDVAVGEPGQGDVLRVGFNERYELELNSRAGRYLCSPRGHAAIQAAANVAENARPDGTLSPTVADISTRMLAYCNVARSALDVGQIDLTQALREPYARALQIVSEALTRVLQRVADIVVRAKFATLANAFAQPIQISSNAWLTPNLQNAAVRRLSFAASGGDLLAKFDLALAVRPQVSLGTQPTAPPFSVPSLSNLDIPDGFHLPVDIRVPFDLIAEHARAQLKGKELPVKVLGTVRIDDVDVYATDTGTPEAPQPKLVIQIDFSGGASGKLYLWGTPTIDPATRVISFPDLNYTTDTSRLLVRIFAPLLTSNFVVSRVRDAATFDASKLIDEQTAPFMQTYQRTFTAPDGTVVSVSAVPAPVGLNGISVDAVALSVHAVVNGTVSVSAQADADALRLAAGRR
jgi:hypothetical protein